jgi:PAS domain S-box-containing protein
MTTAPESNQELLHNLRVHQIELEQQNEQLRGAQQALEASRARYYDLYEHAPIGYLTLSPAGLIQEANVAAAGLLGLSQGALVERALHCFILPADQDIYYRHRRELTGEGARHCCEVRFLQPDGDSRWVQLEVTAAKDADGELAFRAVVSDIAPRKLAEETLILSEARHRALFEKSYDALMTLVPPTCQFTSGNARTLAMFGVENEAGFVTRSLTDYAPSRQPDGALSADKLAQLVAAALRDGACVSDWTCRRESGEEFPATVLLTRIELDGRTLLQATVRDETAVRQLQVMLTQADRLTSMGLLAASVAHEINNPLTYALYNIESVALDLPKLGHAVERCLHALRCALGDEAAARVLGNEAVMLGDEMLKDLHERAREALGGVERIRTIAKAIGTFSHVETGERSRVDLNYALQCASTMAANDIKVRAELSFDLGELPLIWASAGRLSQVFLNLLVNAAHSIDEGDAGHNTIHVRSWVLHEDVFVSITDSGKGISTEHLARIFEPFFTTKAVGIGSGLGLSICRNIVLEFGGEIGVESTLGTGTCFTVRLPIRRGVSSNPPPERPAVTTSVRGRILIVDDEPAIRRTMVRLLTRSHEVVAAESGIEARAILLGDQSFDLILCDLMMPEMTGMELHGWLSAEYPTLADRVVFLTGGAFTVNSAKYLAHIKNVTLEKPCESGTLMRIVSELVTSVHRAREAATAGGSAPGHTTH